MKRLFAAVKIKPDEHLLRHYYNLRKDLKHDRIKWVEPEKMHLTLKFFGETPEEKINDMNRVIKPFATEIAPFSIKVTGTGIFGSRYKPRVIWFGIDDQDKLKHMGNALLRQLDQAGFENDRQNFVPHFTVGRIKEISNKDYFQKTIQRFKTTFFQEVKVDEIHLYESFLKPEGPTYSLVEKYHLGLKSG